MKNSRRTMALALGLAVLVLMAASVANAQGVMFVKNNNVGIGTADPKVSLHLDSPGGDDFAGMGPTPDLAAGAGFNFGYAASVNGGFFNTRSGGFTNLLFGTANQTRMIINGTNGYIGLGGNVTTFTPTSPIHHFDNGATLTVGGVWTNGSSRELKQDIYDLSADSAMATLRNLNPVTFRYKIEPDEEYVGFIAEDVPDLVATSDRKTLASMDVVAVLTKVVKEQQTTIEELSRRLNQLEGR